MEVILYTTHCPRCDVLEKKLNQKEIHFEPVTDTQIMISKGFTNTPILEVDGKTMEFKEAVDWVNDQK